jgi:hypothetical protein
MASSLAIKKQVSSPASRALRAAREGDPGSDVWMMPKDFVFSFDSEDAVNRTRSELFRV